MTNVRYFCRRTARCMSQGLAFVKCKLSIHRRMHQLGLCSFLHCPELETAFFPSQTEDYEQKEDEVADEKLSYGGKMSTKIKRNEIKMMGFQGNFCVICIFYI